MEITAGSLNCRNIGGIQEQGTTELRYGLIRYHYESAITGGAVHL